MEAVLRVRVCFKFFGEQTISAAGPSLSNSSWKPINSIPYIRSPIIGIPPLSSQALIPSLELELPEGIFRSEVPRFGKQSLATHNLEVLRQRLQFLVLLLNCRYDGFERDQDGFPPISCSCFRHFSFFPQPLPQLWTFSPPGFLPPANCYGVPASQLPVTQNCGVPAIQLLAALKKQPHHSFFQQGLILQKNAEEKEGTLKYLSSLFLPLFPFTLTETVYQLFFDGLPTDSLNCYNSVTIRIQLPDRWVTITM